VAYTIAVGEFPAGEEATSAGAKVAKLAIKPVSKQAMKKNRKMTRLFYGVYADYDAYTAALEKLKQSAKGAFAIEKGGKYSVYAGSFSSPAGAEKEKKLLQAKGVSVKLQSVVLPLSSVKITAGHFAAKSDADKAAARLKAEGLAVKVVPAGK
jgi:cell division protein FtsN